MKTYKLFTAASFFLLVLFLKSGFCGQFPENQPFKLITIQDGIKMVLEDSRLLKITLLDKDQALQNSLIARSALLPQLSASLEEDLLNHQPAARFDSLKVNSAEKQSVSYGFDVYKTLFDFGKSLSNYKAELELVNARQAGFESVRNIAILEFIVAYFDLLEAEKMIGVAEKEVESITSYLSDIEHLYEHGAAIKNDLLPARVRLADAKQKLISSRNARSVSEARLKSILSIPLREKIMVKDLEMRTANIPGMEEAWMTAQTERSELKVFGDQIKSSLLSEKSKSVRNYPVLFADTGYEYTQNKFTVHQDEIFLHLGAKAQLYDGGAAKAEVRKERAKRKQLSEQLAQLLEDIGVEIENSYLACKDAGEKLLVSGDALSQARENVRVNRVKYTEGSANTTDVLEAITLQTVAETNYCNSDYELKRNYAKFMYSMGIDLSLIYERMKREENGSNK
ncbi:MAG: TolC family protein [Candidatus Omnitrophica bacterium]|nr:TolC family protein [Candidatus Omnitrophota bacterium]